MNTMPEEYRVAREIYGICRTLPVGKTISRAELNHHFGASSDIRKNDRISKVIKHLLWSNLLQKKVNRESCQVYFWATATDPTPGDKVVSEPNEKIINYLLEPPSAPAPTPVVTKSSPPEVVLPVRAADVPLAQRVIQALQRRNGVASSTVLQQDLNVLQVDLLETIQLLWEDGKVLKDSNALPNCVCVWLEGCENSAGVALVDDSKKPIKKVTPAKSLKVKPKATKVALPAKSEEFLDDGSEDEPFEEDEEEFFIMLDLKDKNNRILLRPTGDTITLSLREIEFIRGLKKPFVTL